MSVPRTVVKDQRGGGLMWHGAVAGVGICDRPFAIRTQSPHLGPDAALLQRGSESLTINKVLVDEVQELGAQAKLETGLCSFRAEEHAARSQPSLEVDVDVVDRGTQCALLFLQYPARSIVR